MANLLYRTSLTPSLPTSTTVKNAPLTNLEVDANFKSLNDNILSLTAATEATSINVASKIVTRDASGNFAAGVISATDFNSTSDERLKTDIREINGLGLIAQIDPVQFEWKDSGKLSYGVIAQQIEAILPELVVEREDGMKGVSYIPIIAMLIDAVKKLDARVKELESNK